MKILIVYDSLFGNTEKIANAIKDGIGKKGIIITKAKDFKSGQTKNIDLLIVGSPVHGGKPSRDTKKFLEGIPNNELKKTHAAAFDTGIPVKGQKAFVKMIIKLFGYSTTHITSILKNKGAKIVGAETFFVLDKEGPLKDGEIDRAKNWAKAIIDNLR